MKEEKNESKLKKVLLEILNRGEDYLCGAMFIFLMVLLTVQVISRYIFHHSFTWTEEIAVLVFVWMSFLGVAGSVLTRQHLKIDFLVDMLPFKAKKVLLIFDDLVFMIFCIYILKPFMSIINNLNGATTALLKIPKVVGYIVIPLSLGLAIIRLVQDIIKLIGENERNLGQAKTMIDLVADECYFLEHHKGMTHEEALAYIEAEERRERIAETKKKETDHAPEFEEKEAEELAEEMHPELTGEDAQPAEGKKEEKE